MTNTKEKTNTKLDNSSEELSGEKLRKLLSNVMKKINEKYVV